MKERHIVLGAAGPAGRSVVAALQEKVASGLDAEIVTAGRRDAGEWGEAVTYRRIDLRDREATTRGVADCTHVYLCVGLPYDVKVWRREWPLVMGNVIAGCEAAGALLVFLDNVYMYGPRPLSRPFDESHPQEPPSRKGEVRKEIAAMALDAHRQGRVRAVIGRAADFYGPGVQNSALYISFLERMVAGKAPMGLAPPEVPHTYTYVPDIGPALVALAGADDAWGAAWHLPVSEAVTMEEVCGRFNTLLNTDFSYRQAPRLFLKAMGLFVTPVGELMEMLYQFDDPYIVDDGAFRRRFPDVPTTSFEEGSSVMVESFRSS